MRSSLLMWIPVLVGLVVVLALLGGAAWLIVARERRLQRRCRHLRRRELCYDCGYSLQEGHSGLCPECGNDVHPRQCALCGDWFDENVTDSTCRSCGHFNRDLGSADDGTGGETDSAATDVPNAG